ncbi:flavin-containing monooxygenase [Streptomyces sp. BI20]|uniref:flavin-containing monooxygenase n=1 Tax=Streptomyces sp. BI20 TaxID=3403460 RepID=UPI003C7433EC
MADLALSTQPYPVYVIGAGPGGLAVAACLRRRGVRAVVVERGEAVGTSWRGHYDRLRLHTTRRLSGLPGLPIPRASGRWPARDDFVRYLERYAEHHELEIVTGVDTTRVDHAPETLNGPRWLLRGTGGRVLAARSVVVATGYNHTPHTPDWPGLDTFTGELTHARDYRERGPWAGRDVLVVGVGNTGAEIAADLADPHPPTPGGRTRTRGAATTAPPPAARVRLAVRTAPHILRRSTLGWPSQRTGILVRRLPVPLVDRMGRALARVAVPDLTPFGLPRPDGGLYSRVLDGAIPVQDAGLIAAVRAGRVEPVAAVTGFDGPHALLADGSRVTPEAVIAATGYRRGLEPLVGHLHGVLDGHGLPTAHGPDSPAGNPGLHFTGLATPPISGSLRELALEAERTARALAG